MMRSFWRAAPIVCLGWAALLPLPARTAVILSLNPGTAVSNVGDSTVVELRVSGLGEQVAPSLSAFDIDVTFDPLLLQFESLSFGGAQGDALNLTSTLPFTSFTLLQGLINLAELSSDPPNLLDALQPAAFELAVLRFSSVAAGVADLGLTINALGDALGDPIQAEIRGASIAISVPEPGSLALVASAMAVMACLRRRSHC